MKRLKGVWKPERRVVWVVGASRGIGREISLQFALRGHEVCVSSRSGSALGRLVRDIKQLDGRASAYPCDIRDNGDIKRVYRSITRAHGWIDTLILNAGITSFRNFVDLPTAFHDSVLATNLAGPLACARAVVPGMMKRKRGWLIAILSTAAMGAFRGSSSYAASKAGLQLLMDVVREEVRAYGIKVTTVFPGATETTMWSDHTRRKYGRRMMRPSSVAETVALLCNVPDDVVVEKIVLRPVLGDLG